MVKHEFKNVNSKKLVDEIADFVDFLVDGSQCELLTEEYYREATTTMVTDLMSEFEVANSIDNFKIVGDLRNNHMVDLERGMYTIDVHFRQRNCSNVTKLRFITYRK